MLVADVGHQSFVQKMSMSRMHPIYVQSLSSICPEFCLCSIFVFIMSTFVHFLSNKCPPVHKMSKHCSQQFLFLSKVCPNFSLLHRGQIVDKFWNCIFSFCNLETLQLDKSWTNFGHKILTLYAFPDKDKI